MPALKEITPYADYLAHYLNIGAIGSSADLAIQQCLGLLPKRGVGNSPDYRDYSDVVVAQPQ